MKSYKLYLAEFIGTFALVFTGTGAIVFNKISSGSIGHIGISLTFGFIVMAMIYSLGDISGAHLNPAVTFGFWLSKRFKGRAVLPYILSQIGGALLASFILRIVFLEKNDLGLTMPLKGMVFQTFILEVIISFFLMFIILRVSTGSKEKGIMAGVAVGGTVALMAIFAGPVSGASMNPARSIGPAVAACNLEYLWIYLSAPLAGSALASYINSIFNNTDKGDKR